MRRGECRGTAATEEVNFCFRLIPSLPLASFSLVKKMRQKWESSPSSRLPLGGKLSLKATDEGRNLFSIFRIFSSEISENQGAQFFSVRNISLFQGFPPGGGSAA